MPTNRHTLVETKRLLARAPVIRGACELDLLAFLHRHPRSLLTNEQLAAFVGYDMKQIAGVIEAFVIAGLLARTQNPMHAAHLFHLVLQGPHGGGIREILELASTRQGRRNLLEVLGAGSDRTAPVAAAQQSQPLHIIA